MRNIFIINPNAGSTKKGEQLIAAINDAEKKTGMKCEIYFTRYAGDGYRYIRETCENDPEQKIRFFGAGGDGTLNEVVNGCHGFDNAIAGIIPIGTGNDFVRIFGSEKYFLDIEAQLKGNSKPIDLIRCEYVQDGDKKISYCDNMINIGFDSNVVAKADEIHRKSFVNGSAAYILGVAVILIKKKGADLRIELDDGYVHDGPLLLTAVANGNFCGGGVKSSPESILDDGEIEVSVIKDVSRTRFISLFPSYSKGTHFSRKGADEIIDYHKVKSARIRTNAEPMMVSNDGELFLTDEIYLEVEERAVRFSVPLMD